jgi:hypothetical protein
MKRIPSTQHVLREARALKRRFAQAPAGDICGICDDHALEWNSGMEMYPVAP